MAKKDTFWFSHDYNSRSDRKILKLRMKHGMQGLGIYWCIIEMLYAEGGYLSKNDYERITFELQTKYDIVTSVINDFDLFDSNNDVFWSSSILNRLKIRADKSEKNRSAINERWDREREKKKEDLIRTYNDRNTIKDNTLINSIVKPNPQKKQNGEASKQFDNHNPQSSSIWASRVGIKVPEGEQGGKKDD